MRRFQFRLGSLMRLRSQLERVARRELAAATATVHSIDQQLIAAALGRQEFGETAVRGGPSAQLARALEAGISRHEWRLLGKQRKATAELEVVRQDYLKKARDLGALEHLRDRRHEEWLAEVQKEEQEGLDEMTRIARGSGDGMANAGSETR